MKLTDYQSSEEQWHDDEQHITQKRRVQKSIHQTNTLARKFIEATDTIEIDRIADPAQAVEASPVLNTVAPHTIAIPSFSRIWAMLSQ